MHLMENGGHPRIIIEVLLDHVASIPGRHRQVLGGALDNDREGNNTGTEGISNKIGTIEFDGMFSALLL